MQLQIRKAMILRDELQTGPMGRMLPPRTNSGSRSTGASTMTVRPPSIFSSVQKLYQVPAGKITRRCRARGWTTGQSICGYEIVPVQHRMVVKIPYTPRLKPFFRQSGEDLGLRPLFLDQRSHFPGQLQQGLLGCLLSSSAYRETKERGSSRSRATRNDRRRPVLWRVRLHPGHG